MDRDILFVMCRENGISTRYNMLAATLYRKLKDELIPNVYAAEAALKQEIQRRTRDENDQRASDENEANQGAADEKQQEQAAAQNNNDNQNAPRCAIIIQCGAIRGDGRILKSATMKEWSRRLREYTVYDQDGTARSLYEVIQSIAGPTEDDEDHNIVQLRIDGHRLDAPSKFPEDGEFQQKRQWQSNQFMNKCELLKTIAAKNGSSWMLLSADTTTRAEIELGGGSVNLSACNIFYSGPKYVPPALDDYKERFKKMWNEWKGASDEVNIDIKQELEESLQRDDNVELEESRDLAQQIKILQDKRDNNEITEEIYQQQQRELTQKLLGVHGLHND